jgi:hypothetical protein
LGEAILCAAGLAAIGYASGLERAARPPFIMGGLLVLGVTMATVYPVLAALRAPPEA